MSTTKINISYAGIIAVLAVGRNGLLQGDGALERVKLHEVLAEKGQSLEVPDADLSKATIEIELKTSLLKAWVSGAATTIMRGTLKDNQVGMVLEASSALKVRGAVVKRIPEFGDQEVLDMDGDPEVTIDE